MAVAVRQRLIGISAVIVMGLFGKIAGITGNTAIDTPLLAGAAIFGVGWGLGGFCPGPAWTALAIGTPGTLVFLPAMLAGIVLGGAAQSFSIFTTKGA